MEPARYEEVPHQEMIPGDDTNMRIHHLLDRNGKVRFASFGQTLLEDMRPMGGGQSARHREPTDETIVAEAARLSGGCRLHRFANFDIKVDPAATAISSSR